MNIIKGTFTIT